jgi:hypothetical protein
MMQNKDHTPLKESKIKRQNLRNSIQIQHPQRYNKTLSLEAYGSLSKNRSHNSLKSLIHLILYQRGDLNSLKKKRILKIFRI